MTQYTKGTVVHQYATVAYHRAGLGPTPLLLFHGFGQDHRAFIRLTDNLPAEYTAYSFDLFFHGQSEWQKGDRPLSKKYWQLLLETFLQQEQITTFAIAGFSLGAKFVLATLEAFPAQVTRAWLLAPDGIKPNPWYSLATYPRPLRRFFKSLINHPNRLSFLILWARRLHLADSGVLRFVQTQMDTPKKRYRVYMAWVVLRWLTFDTTALANTINQHQMNLTILAGRRDKIVSPDSLRDFIKLLHQCRFEVVEASHYNLIRHAIPYIITH